MLVRPPTPTGLLAVSAHSTQLHPITKGFWKGLAWSQCSHRRPPTHARILPTHVCGWPHPLSPSPHPNHSHTLSHTQPQHLLSTPLSPTCCGLGRHDQEPCTPDGDRQMTSRLLLSHCRPRPTHPHPRTHARPPFDSLAGVDPCSESRYACQPLPPSNHHIHMTLADLWLHTCGRPQPLPTHPHPPTPTHLLMALAAWILCSESR